MDGHPRIDHVLSALIACTGYLPMWLAREWEIAKYLNDATWCVGRTDREEMAARGGDAKTCGGFY